MSDHLFVYGTLLSGIVPPTLAPLMSKLAFEGPATLPGELFDLGPYPAAMPILDASSLIHGELYALPADPSVLAILDNYEGHFPDRPNQSLFRRIRVTVTRGDGRTVPAWMYAWNRPTENAVPIANGDYRAAKSPVRTTG